MDLSIIIVTHNSLRPVERCLASLREHPPACMFETIIVDNASSDGTPAMIASRFGEFKLVANNDNRGYSRGVNQGISFSTGPLILILNPDIEITSGSIDALIDFMKENPDAGIAGSKLLYPDGTLQYSCRAFYTVKTLLFRRTFLGKLFPGSKTIRDHLMLDYDHEKSRRVDWVLGGCMMVRREAMEKVGMMDERFFLYFEDTDWCFRMRQHGWHVYYVPRSVMTHSYERSSARSILRKPFLMHLLSLLRYYEKWNRLFYFFRRHRSAFKTSVFFLVDLLAINAGFFAAYYLRLLFQPFFRFGLYPLSWYYYFILFYHMVFFLTFFFMGLYRIKRETTAAEEFAQVTRAVLTVFAILLVSTYLTRIRIFSRAVLVGHAVFSIFAVFGMRRLVRKVHSRLVRASFDLRRVLLAGCGDEVRAFSESISYRPEAGIDIVGVIGEEEGSLGGVEDLPLIIERFKVQEVIIFPSCASGRAIMPLLLGSGNGTVKIRIVSPLARIMTRGVTVEQLGGVEMFSIERGTQHIFSRALSRFIDIATALVLIPVSAILSAVIRIYGRFSGDISFFREKRTAGARKSISWPRGVLGSGREIPDIFKVEIFAMLLAGKVALAGPPSLPSSLEAGGDFVPGSYRPGITGKWRFSPTNDWKRALENELLESRDRSVSEYLFILFKSIKKCIFGEYPLWFIGEGGDN